MKFKLSKVANKLLHSFPEVYSKVDVKSYFDKISHRYPEAALKKFEYESSYQTNSGTEIPVYKHYRYSIKPGWKYYGPLAALDQLNALGLLDNRAQSFLSSTVGYRTLTKPLDEAYQVLNKYLNKHADLFLSLEIPVLDKRPLKPTSREIDLSLKKTIKNHKRFLKIARRTTEFSSGNKPSKILEIGYTSGGESIIAFEKMGFDAHAIDYFFNDSVQQSTRHEYIKKLTKSNVTFHVGDISKETPFKDETFDIIYSKSVIEHILDVKSAFKEMFRILKKGGVIIHNYGSFQMPGGGHSLGILDSPWAHIRLDESEYYDYIRKMRPYEADIAIDWIQNALKPRDTFSTIQKAVVEAGFTIEHWSNARVKDHYKYLSHDVLEGAFNNVPGLTLEDLISKGILFVGGKK